MTDSSGTGRPEWLGTDLEDLDGVTPEVVGKVPDADLYLLAPTDVDLEDPPDRPIPVRMLNTDRGRLYDAVEYRNLVARNPYFEPLPADQRPEYEDVASRVRDD